MADKERGPAPRPPLWFWMECVARHQTVSNVRPKVFRTKSEEAQQSEDGLVNQEPKSVQGRKGARPKDAAECLLTPPLLKPSQPAPKGKHERRHRRPKNAAAPAESPLTPPLLTPSLSAPGQETCTAHRSIKRESNAIEAGKQQSLEAEEDLPEPRMFGDRNTTKAAETEGDRCSVYVPH